MSLSLLYSTSLTNGSLLYQSSDFDPSVKASEFAAHWESLRQIYFKGAFHSVAAASAESVTITDSMLDVDDFVLRDSRSLWQTVASKQAAQKAGRFNAARCQALYAGDFNFPLLMELATRGAIIDPDPEFIPQPIPEDFRPTEITLSKVFQGHAIESWEKGRGLLLRVNTLQEVDQQHLLHCNHSHLVYKFGVPRGRWCIDPSHRSDDCMPLNGGIAKELSINHYTKATFPTLVGILAAINNRRLELDIGWNKIWAFKEDIKACFPQMDMDPASAFLLAIRLTVSIIFIHLAGSFGWTGAPMAWAIIGAAMLRYCKVRLPKIDLFLICDDFVGAGLYEDCVLGGEIVRDNIIATCGPGSVSMDKSVLSQQPVILGWYVDFLDPMGASIAPNNTSIGKMRYYFFSFDPSKPQPLHLWQVLHAYAERYSHGMRGMRCFVSVFAHMIRATGPNASNSNSVFTLKHQFSRRKVATASALFAIEMWRVASFLLFLNPAAFSIPIETYLAMNGEGSRFFDFRSVSDASPYRICSAIYDNKSGSLLAWTSVKLNFAPDVKGQFQCNREYLGLLLTLFLIARKFPDRSRSPTKTPLSVQWVNDNTGALAWGDKEKSSSLPSTIVTMAVSSVQLLTNITLAGVDWIPGLTMGDIDHESRREEHLAAGDYSAPSLLPHLFIDLESVPRVMDIVRDCEPARTEQYKVTDYHSIFMNIQQQITTIMN